LPFRAIFFVSPGLFSARALHAWLTLGHDVALLVQPRGRWKRSGALHWLAPRWSFRAALERGRIPTLEVSRGDDLERALRPADVAISVGFPFRIPMRSADALPHGGVNLHPALLPAFRGPRPLTALCLEGGAERHGGVTLHCLTADFDSGPLIAQEPVPLRGDHAAWMLELARAHGRLMRPLQRYLAGEIAPVPQDEHGASFHRPSAPRLSPEQPAAELARICRTLGASRRLHVELAGRRVAVSGYLGSTDRSGALPRVGRLTLDFDAVDERVRLARWLPGTRRWRRGRALVRLALARIER
jgi:methionyl-tRNA formyltransferase